ncbi:TonB family protein [Opitutus sp. ER46]|uniref:TonB family protein n=1 Tax=Opitutus sp. ER46 TaxID=2161864 RepID=UPI000D319BDE|nr:TonB family protein [Opitutus sp. ER46]PTX95468.1 hypothetical protein DB354_08560 [Opitutus sp. ER46]
MKAISKLVLFSLGIFSAVAASASVPEAAYLANCRKDPGVPVPISVVTPTVGREFSGLSVEVEFTVDQKGKPADLVIAPTVDDELAEAVSTAVKKWKFKPAERNGQPVATRVVLPVKVVDPISERATFASN